MTTISKSEVLEVVRLLNLSRRQVRRARKNPRADVNWALDCADTAMYCAVVELRDHLKTLKCVSLLDE